MSVQPRERRTVVIDEAKPCGEYWSWLGRDKHKGATCIALVLAEGHPIRKASPNRGLRAYTNTPTFLVNSGSLYLKPSTHSFEETHNRREERCEARSERSKNETV